MDATGGYGSTERVMNRCQSIRLRLRLPGSRTALVGFAFAHLLLVATCLPGAAATARPNVLFFIADALRAELGCYGKPVKTPNNDALAARGVRVDRAFCQSPLCNPSHTLRLTGLYPHHTGVFGNRGNFRL